MRKTGKWENHEDKAEITEGHFVMVGCGHRGRPCRGEEKRISRLLRKSGFIPMLEEIYVQQKLKRQKTPLISPRHQPTPSHSPANKGGFKSDIKIDEEDGEIMKSNEKRK